MDQRISYSREEVIAAGSNWPTRGLLCHECGRYIPVFEDLSEEDEQRVRQRLQQNRFTAMKELRDLPVVRSNGPSYGPTMKANRPRRKKLSFVPTAASRCEHRSPNSAAFACATGTKTMSSL